MAIAAIGFGTGGIAAGSLAAAMMSSAWTTGVGVGLVSILQSVGAAGMGMVGVAATGGWGWVRESERESEEFPFGITDCKDSTEGLNGGGRPDDKDGPDGEDGMGRIA